MSGATSASFVYDGDGHRVKFVLGGVTTSYVGTHFEWITSTTTMVKYYYAGSQRIAMRKGGVVYYLHGDHLGSTSLTTCGSGSTCGGNGTEVSGSRTLYYPYGEVRWPTGGSTLPTDYTFTGQRNEASFGLMDYNARYYDPALGRFIQADTIVPSPANPQSLNRYAYGYNNPLAYSDPDGHIPVLLTAAIGGFVGMTFSIASQMHTAMRSGMAQTYKEAWQKVDPAKVAGATVAGVVAGATMGLVAPAVAGSVLPGLAASGASSAAVHTVGFGISVGAGSLSGIAGGRAGALTEGAVAEGLANRKDGTSWSLTDAYQGACNSGLWSNIQKDAIVGGAGGAFGYAAQTLSSALAACRRNRNNRESIV